MKKLFTLFALFGVCALYAQTGSLKLQLDEGQEFKMLIEQNSEVVQSVMGQEIKVNSKAQITSLYKVIELQNDQWVIEASFQEVFSQAENPMTGKITFGSDAQYKDDNSLAIRALINKPYTIMVTKGGRVTSVKGLDEIFADLESELASLSRARRRTATEVVTAGFGVDPCKVLVEMCFVRDPGRELRTGLVWMVSDTTKSQGSNAFADYQYRVESLDEQAIHYSVSGTVQSDLNSKPIIANGAEIKMNIGGPVKGKGAIEPATGWVIQAELSNDISGSATANVAGNIMDIPMKVKTSITIKRL